MKDVLVVVPVYNEENILNWCIDKVCKFLDDLKSYNFDILIADNASTDSTPEISKEICKKFQNVEYRRIAEKGRGNALKKVWKSSDHDILSYMDVDLSTSLLDYVKLLRSIEKENDIAIASRHLKSSDVKRSLKRGVLSRGYNFLLKILFNVGFRDAQCGCKALDGKYSKKILDRIKDDEWFFDTELLIKSERLRASIEEIGVNWIENDDSKVKIFETVLSYLVSLFSLKLEIAF
ncbi:MAG: glycosyltransferase [Candidatus Aenigmatarchaeota archaeon]